jgi:hypothetical protein
VDLGGVAAAVRNQWPFAALLGVMSYLEIFSKFASSTRQIITAVLTTPLPASRVGMKTYRIVNATVLECSNLSRHHMMLNIGAMRDKHDLTPPFGNFHT